jgi:EmrB/QacA subfamily drug resistance transporter
MTALSEAESLDTHRNGEVGTFCPRERRKFVLIAAILASALGFIDGSILAIAIPAIRTDLSASLVDAQWISNAYALTLSALILVGGAAGDRFGLRKTFMTGIVLFVVASMACAVAPDAKTLIAFRALQGVGAAIMVPCSLAIIAKAYPKSERGQAIGIWAAASALTTALGPVIGGFVLSSFDPGVWRAIFAINLPLGGLAVFILYSSVPSDSPAARRALDFAGAALATIGFGALAFGLSALSAENQAGGAFAAISAIATGLVVLLLFVLWELRQRDPMVELRLFANGPFAGANIATFFLYFSLSAIMFYLPMLLIAGWGLTSAEVGFTFVPLSAAIALLSRRIGKWSDRTGPRTPIALGSLLVAAASAGLAVIAALHIRAFWAGVLPMMVVMGFGMAFVVSPLSTAIMTAVEDRETGAASGINNAVARIAGLFAVAAMGAVAAYVYAASAGARFTQNLPGYGEPVIEKLAPALETVRLAASDSAFAAVSAITAGLCVFSALIAWLSVANAPAPAAVHAGLGLEG